MPESSFLALFWCISTVVHEKPFHQKSALKFAEDGSTSIRLEANRKEAS